MIEKEFGMLTLFKVLETINEKYLSNLDSCQYLMSLFYNYHRHHPPPTTTTMSGHIVIESMCSWACVQLLPHIWIESQRVVHSCITCLRQINLVWWENCFCHWRHNHAAGRTGLHGFLYGLCTFLHVLWAVFWRK